MPASRRFDLAFAKLVVVVNGVVPGALLLWAAYNHQLGVNEVNYTLHTTGLLSLVCLMAALAITPLRRLTGWNVLIGLRRSLGLLSFFYLAAHFLVFFLLDRDGSVSSTLGEIVSRRYLQIGTGALVIMLALAITSTDGMVTRLGARRWKALHRLVYVAAIGGVLHYYLLVKADTSQPRAFAIALGVLLGLRLAWHYVDLRRGQQKGPARAAVPPTKKRGFWSGELQVARVFAETPDVRTFRLVAPDGGPLPFDHRPGQYLNLALTIDGKRVRRSYTIASAPSRGHACEITVKRKADGWASGHLHDTLVEGSTLAVSAPAGKFVFTGAEATRVVLLAGGVGITPLMAIVRYLTDRAWTGDIHLVLSMRTRRDVIFEEELDYLARRFPNLHVTVTLSDEADPTWAGERGRITAALLTRVIPDLEGAPVYLCGPEPMMIELRRILGELGVPEAQVHTEAFVSPPTGDAAAPEAEPAVALEPGDACAIRFARSGATAELPFDRTILEAAEDAGVDLAFECRSGVCGQCKIRLLDGQVTMDAQDALTTADRAKGFILACQARARRDVTIDA